MSPARPAPPAETFRAALELRAPAFDLTPNDLALEPVSRYLSELFRWAGAINLTGARSPEAVVGEALEAIFASRFFSAAGQLVDIGSGGGMPGVVLAICHPQLVVTLLEPRRRRGAFLAHLVRAVPLKNARVLEGRVESLDGFWFDAATARGVGGLSRALSKPRFLKEGGKLLLFATSSGLRRNRPPEDFVLEVVHTVPESRERVLAVFRLFHVEQRP
jgi:16S rRNA (guanine527-N7)-methyltransferase